MIDYQNKIAEMQQAAELEKLSESDRQKAELENLKSALESREKQLQRRELEISTAKVLEQRKLPTVFADYFIDSDSEKTLAKIKEFEKEYTKAVEKAVNEKLKSSSGAPKSTGGGVPTNLMNVILKNKVAV